jgi:hypothetical protein
MREEMTLYCAIARHDAAPHYKKDKNEIESDCSTVLQNRPAADEFDDLVVNNITTSKLPGERIQTGSYPALLSSTVL